jgi:hypothetical protein
MCAQYIYLKKIKHPGVSQQPWCITTALVHHNSLGLGATAAQHLQQSHATICKFKNSRKIWSTWFTPVPDPLSKTRRML